MSTLDDKILGEKLHYYCSSSEEEDNNEDNEDNDPINTEPDYKKTSIIRNEQIREWEGYSVNVFIITFHHFLKISLFDLLS